MRKVPRVKSCLFSKRSLSIRGRSPKNQLEKTFESFHFQKNEITVSYSLGTKAGCFNVWRNNSALPKQQFDRKLAQSSSVLFSLLQRLTFIDGMMGTCWFLALDFVFQSQVVNCELCFTVKIKLRKVRIMISLFEWLGIANLYNESTR